MPGKKKTLTDLTLKAFKPAPKGQRYELGDKDVKGFGVRVNDRGEVTFVLAARYPDGGKHPTRATLGHYPNMTLAQARQKALTWKDAIRRGEDPRTPEQEERKRRAANTFGVLGERYLKSVVAKHRRAEQTSREFRNHLIKRWDDKPVAAITKADVREMVASFTERGHERQAHNILGLARAFFNWCVEHDYIAISPCYLMRPKRLIGEKHSRDRVLEDRELVALWRATERMGYPFGPLYQLLLLTGTRKTEAAGACWSEFDLDRGRWTIPPERFKSNATHRLPLSEDAVKVLTSLPRFEHGDYLFSTTYGRTAVMGFSKAKERLDRLMVEELGRRPEPWVVHDLRRTVRTRLSSLKVPDVVAEKIIGHDLKGIERVYNQHRYEDEMREALETWAALLSSIVNPPAKDDVAQLRPAEEALV